MPNTISLTHPLFFCARRHKGKFRITMEGVLCNYRALRPTVFGSAGSRTRRSRPHAWANEAVLIDASLRMEISGADRQGGWEPSTSAALISSPETTRALSEDAASGKTQHCTWAMPGTSVITYCNLNCVQSSGPSLPGASLYFQEVIPGYFQRHRSVTQISLYAIHSLASSVQIL